MKSLLAIVLALTVPDYYRDFRLHRAGREGFGRSMAGRLPNNGTLLCDQLTAADKVTPWECHNGNGTSSGWDGGSAQFADISTVEDIASVPPLQLYDAGTGATTVAYASGTNSVTACWAGYYDSTAPAALANGALITQSVNSSAANISWWVGINTSSEATAIISTAAASQVTSVGAAYVQGQKHVICGRWNAINFVTHSEEFNLWSTTAVAAVAPVVTVNQAADPWGSMTADKVDFPATPGGNISTLNQTIGGACLSSGQCTHSAYVKGVSTDGAIDLCQCNHATCNCTPCNFVSASWSRCEFTTTQGTSIANPYIGHDTFYSGVPHPAQSVYIAAFQTELAASATTYLPGALTTWVDGVKGTDVLAVSRQEKTVEVTIGGYAGAAPTGRVFRMLGAFVTHTTFTNPRMSEISTNTLGGMQ